MIPNEMRRSASAGAALAVAALLAGCASQPHAPIALNAAFAASMPTIGVAMTALPSPEVHLPGASCFACVIAARAANWDLITYAESLTTEDLGSLKEQAAASLRKRGINAVVIVEPVKLRALPNAAVQGPNLAEKSFAAFKTRFGIDGLVVIDITQLGFERPYSAYIARGEPRALLRGAGYMVNLSTNAYEWYEPVEISRAADGNWDEPKHFPGLTNAYYQVIELGKDRYLKPLGD